MKDEVLRTSFEKISYATLISFHFYKSTKVSYQIGLILFRILLLFIFPLHFRADYRCLRAFHCLRVQS